MLDKVVFVTGGSSGIGYFTAQALRDRGCTVYEGSRRGSDLEGVTHIPLDVTNDASVASAVRILLEREGRIDILIHCAGSGISGAVEFTKTEDAIAQLDVNFFGVVRVIREVLPIMRAQGNGRIVSISSVAATFPIPFQAYYSASKSALNSYTLALANEVAPFGITVAAIQPGDIKTGFTAARKKSLMGDEIYGGRISRSVSGMERDEQSGMDPAIVGKMIAKLALKRFSKPVCTLGFGYKMLCLLGKILPISLINRILRWLYAK